MLRKHTKSIQSKRADFRQIGWRGLLSDCFAPFAGKSPVSGRTVSGKRFWRVSKAHCRGLARCRAGWLNVADNHPGALHRPPCEKSYLQIGKMGGTSKNPAKFAAIAKNAKKGGWPKGRPRKKS